MAEVRFEKVGKVYDKKVQAVEDLSFTCQDGEFFAILGPSGCGKSSSLRMLAGLEEITSGDVCIKGRRVNDMSSRERNVAMSFENYGLYDMSIFDNIAYPLKIHKVPKDQITKQVTDMARRLHLTNVLGAKPSSLSSGQKQRVSIARALVRNPDVTIMDEPLSHLDARMRNSMRSIIRHIHDQLHLTTVYVTHDQIEAMTMADKILIMNEGHLQQVGTPDEVYYYPDNLFVAGFVGTPQMNFVECRTQIQDGHVRVVHGQSICFDADKYDDQISEGQEITLGFRPHDVLLSEKPRADYSKGSVYVVEPLGESTIISIKVDDLLIKAEIDGNVYSWTPDEDVFFKLDNERCHLFDQNTAKRIVSKR